MHICFDWDGTLARFEIAHEAAIRRSKTLGQEFDPVWLKETMKSDKHYVLNKELIEKYTGVVDKKIQTIIMTNLFQYHYLGVANEREERVLFEGIKEFLDDLKEKHTLTIATTLRKDIVVEVLKNLDLINYFDYVAGNNPELSYDKQDLVDEVIREKGNLDFMVGDKSDDIDAGQKRGAKGILVSWGSHKTYDKADYVVENVKELEKIISKPL